MHSKDTKQWIFTIGRMNPPTSGHQGLIRKMMEEALKEGLDRVYVVLSSTVDKKNNPLSCEKKKELLVGDVSNVVADLKRKWVAEKGEDSEKIENCQVRVVCMDDPEIVSSEKYGTNPILKCLYYILDRLEERGHGMDKTTLFVGEDRMDSYGWISTYAASKLGRLTIVPVARPPGAISATYVRGLAIDGNMTGFLGEIESVGISRERGEKVYSEIRRVLGEKLKKRKLSPNKTEKSQRKSVVQKSSIATVPKPDSIVLASPGEGYRTRSSTRRIKGL